MGFWDNLVFWVLGITVAAIAVLAIGFYLLVLLTARFERCSIKRLTPLLDVEGPASQSSVAKEIASEAIALGFLYLGAFHDDESNLLKTRHDLYLTPDGGVMLLLPSLVKLGGYRLISRCADDVWLFTGKVAGSSDLSGLRLTKQLPGCTLAQVFRYHQDRVDSHQADLVPFDPETLIRDMRDHNQLRAQRAVDAGYARWVSDGKDCYTSTWRGAFKLAGSLFGNMSEINEASRLAEQYKAQSVAE